VGAAFGLGLEVEQEWLELGLDRLGRRAVPQQVIGSCLERGPAYEASESQISRLRRPRDPPALSVRESYGADVSHMVDTKAVQVFAAASIVLGRLSLLRNDSLAL
jgi:hypothetical protein